MFVEGRLERTLWRKPYIACEDLPLKICRKSNDSAAGTGLHFRHSVPVFWRKLNTADRVHVCLKLGAELFPSACGCRPTIVMSISGQVPGMYAAIDVGEALAFDAFQKHLALEESPTFLLHAVVAISCDSSAFWRTKFRFSSMSFEAS